MKHSYRITKYFTSNETGNLIFNTDEWTSFSVVGLRVTRDDYLLIEDSYLSVIKATCIHLHVNRFKIVEFESCDDDSSIFNNQSLEVEDAIPIARKVLREKLWCKLVSAEVEFHFGYDFYLYVVSNYNLSFFILMKISEDY